MGRCSIPGCEGDENLSYTCNECNAIFCSEHRLPENHYCSVLRNKESSSDDGLFSTGLQGKRGKKRGITDRSRSSSKVRRSKTDDQTESNKPVSNSDDQVESSGRDSRSDDSEEKISPRGSASIDRSPKYGRGSSSSRGSQKPGHPFPTQSTTVSSSVGYRFRWATWLYRVGGIATAALLISILLIAFTPVTMPPGVPAELADPAQGAADATASFATGILNNTTEETSPTTAAKVTETDSPSTATPEPSTSLDRARLERLIHQEINDVRNSSNLGNLKSDDRLQEIARYHSKDMAQDEYFAHTAPDGEEMVDRYDKFGYQCRVPVGDNRYMTGGENVFRTSYTGLSYSEEELAEMVVEGWMDSPGHRENILRSYWRSEGIGVYIHQDGSESDVYVTQNFC